MTRAVPGRPGRPAAATREAALALATERFLAAERIDIQAIARELGLARATMHRWFQTRETLLGELLATLGERRLTEIRAGVPGGGARALLETFDRFNCELAATPRHALSAGTGAGARAAHAHVQRGPRSAACGGGGQALIVAEQQAGRYTPAVAPNALAYAIVRLAEAFIYNDAIVGIRGDTERLREIEAALLGVD